MAIVESVPMRRLLTCLLLLSSLAISCSAPSEPPPSSIQALDRTRILAVESNLKTDPELASAGIQVSAKNYTVVLTGRVTSKEARQKAEDLARRVEGVTEVENKIEVVPAP